MASPTIPGYERLTQIGKGGFSRVYRGEQAKLKRGVAIKVLNFGLNDEADRRSFERECELMGRVSTHPNIVTVHDTAFTEAGQPCIVMEHYPGGSLADLISEVRRLSAKEVLEVGVSIAAALEASHQAGVLHCDLKPQNILISEFGQPALGDFGISTFSEERTRTGGDAGAGFTLAYAAPEIVEGASPSVESDVYSLAATLYTSLAGRRPFYYPGANGEKPTAAEQARRILLEEPAPLVDVGVDPALDQLIRSAMTKDPAARPASAADFARSLYQVGHQLGLGTSSPRIADQGALPVLDPRADFTEPSLPRTATAAAAMPAPGPAAERLRPSEPVASDAAVAPPAPPAPAPFVDDGTELRSNLPDATALRRADDATALRVEPAVPAVEPAVEPVVESRATRRNLAPVIGLLSLLVVAGVLFLVTRGGSEDPTEVVEAEPTVSAPRAEVLLAPPAPQEVVAQRAGADSVIVSWANVPADDVQYEVRRDDSAANPLVGQSPVMFTEIDANDTTCFEVVAIRGNRLSPAGDRTCVSTRGATYVEASPLECVVTCEVSLALTGFAADQAVSVAVIDVATRSAVDVDFDSELVTDSAGAASEWGLTIEEVTTAGMYLIELTPDGSADTYRTVIIAQPAR